MSFATQRQQALAFLSAVDPPNYRALEDMLHENFTHSFLPATLGGFGAFVRSKAEFIDHVRNVVARIFKRFNFPPPKDLVQGQDDHGENVVVLHLVSDGSTASGKPYNNEYMFMFRFADGKILNIKEFLDSKYVTEMLAGEASATSM